MGEGGEEEVGRREGRVAALGGRRLGPSARVSLRMVGCGLVLSFLLPLINISQASLMTRIGLRLGGKHNSVSHQVSKLPSKKNSPQTFHPGGDTPQQSALGCSDSERGGAGGMGKEGETNYFQDNYS